MCKFSAKSETKNFRHFFGVRHPWLKIGEKNFVSDFAENLHLDSLFSADHEYQLCFSKKSTVQKLHGLKVEGFQEKGKFKFFEFFDKNQ